MRQPAEAVALVLNLGQRVGVLDAEASPLLLPAEILELLLQRCCAGRLRAQVGFQFGRLFGEIVAVLTEFRLLFAGVRLLLAGPRLLLDQRGVLLA